MYLTRRQKQVLDFIGERIGAQGYAPSIEEICSHLGLGSTATVHKHLCNLQAKGLIRRSANRSRSIELTGARDSFSAFPGSPASSVPGVSSSGGAAVTLPLLGQIAAGRPIEALEVPEEIDLPESMLGKGQTYVLKVAGDSMIDEQIRDGDYVIVERRDTAADGRIVVALIGGQEVTLKRFYRQADGSVRLQPANVNLSPIILCQGEFRIQGVVIGVLRKYK